MTRIDRTGDCNRRAFLRTGLLTAATSALGAPAATARVVQPGAPNPAEVPMPKGVLARYGTPWYRAPVAITTLLFTPDSRRLIACGGDPDLPGIRATIWDARSGRITATSAVPIDGEYYAGLNQISGTSFPAPNELLLACYNNVSFLIGRVDLATGALTRRTTGTLPPFAGGSPYPSPDASIVVSASNRVGAIPNNKVESEVTAFTAEKGEKLWTVTFDAGTGFAGRAYFTPDSRRVISNAGGTLQLLDARTGKVVSYLDGKGVTSRNVTGVGSDGTWVTYTELVGNSVSVGVWNLTTGQARNLEGTDQYTQLVLTDEGIQAKGGGKIGLWDPLTGKKVRDIPVPADEFPWVASPDGRLVARAVGGSVRVWDATTGRLVPNAPDPAGDVTDLRYLGPGKLSGRVTTQFQVTAGQGATDGTRVTWDTTAKAAPGVGPAGFQGLIDVSPDGRTAVALGQRFALQVRDVATRAVLRPLTSDIEYPALSCPSGRFTRDGTKFVAVANGTNRLIVWDVGTGGSRSITLSDQAGQVVNSPVRLLDDDRAAVFVVAQPGNGLNNPTRVLIIDLRTEKAVASFVTSFAAPAAAAVDVTPGLGRAAVMSFVAIGNPTVGYQYLETVNVFEVATGARLCRVDLRLDVRNLFARLPVVALSRDGRTLVTSSGPTATAWEVATGKERLRFPHGGEITSATFSPDGRAVAVASRNAPVWEWEFLGARPAEAARFDPDALWAALASEDAAKGFGAIRALVRSPADACELLDARLRPAAAVDRTRVKALVERLADEDFQTREAAERELDALQGQGLTGLRVADQTDPEVRARLNRVLSKAASTVPPTADTRRAVRAVEAVEWLAVYGNREAAKLLERWAGGAPDARLTREAATAALRLRASQP